MRNLFFYFSLFTFYFLLFTKPLTMTPLFTDPFFFGKSWSATDYLIVGVYAIFSILIFASYFLRSIPPFKQIWWFVKWLLVMMLVKLSINFLKKEVKEWWEKK